MSSETHGPEPLALSLPLSETLGGHCVSTGLSITGQNSWNSFVPPSSSALSARERDQHFVSLSWSASPAAVVPTTSAKLEKQGLSRMSLTAGSVNMIVIPTVLSVFPAYFWVLHTLNLWVLIPVWYARVVRQRRGQWFIVEPCWVVNCFMGVYLAASAFGLLSRETQLWAFRGCFQMSLGFLSWSVLVSQNACIYHSVSTVSAIVIHLMPGLVFMTLRWQKEVGSHVEEVWPGIFPSVADMVEQTSSVQLFLAGLAIYGVWWVLYLTWLLSIGIGLPDRGSPTIYNNFRKKHLKTFQRTGLKSQRAQAIVYMIVHLILCSAAFAWAIACWWNFYVHLVWFCVLLSFAIWQSADYYTREVFEKCVNLEVYARAAEPDFLDPFADGVHRPSTSPLGERAPQALERSVGVDSATADQAVRPGRIISMEEEYD